MSRELVIVVTRFTRQYGAISTTKFRARLRGRRGDRLLNIGYGNTVVNAIDDMWTCPRGVTVLRAFEDQP